MPTFLRAEEFAPEAAFRVAGFSCGVEPWEEAIAEWITGEGVFHSMVDKGTRVWMYLTPDDDLVGYGSLGQTRRRWPQQDGDWLNLSIIPMMGIQTPHQGMPKDDPPKFSHQILGDLIHKARQDGRPLLLLYVHEENQRAIKLYEKFDFVAQSGPPKGGYIAMLHRLS